MSYLSTRARVAGFLYIVSSAVGFLRLISISNKLIVSGDAAATAANIAAHESLFRWGMFSYLIAGVLFLCVTFALYRLLEGVDRGLATVMVILGGVISTTIFVVNTVTDAGALMTIRGTGFMTAFEKPQRDALAMLFLELHHHLDVANSVLWGVWLIPFGLLVYRSGFLPRLLGVWLMAGCVAYLAFSLTGMVFPSIEERVFAFGTPFRVGELATMFWLLIVGARKPPVSGDVVLGPVTA